jgi:hypothetical protein
LGSVVNDSAHIAARFGPIGALTVGTVGFAVFYAVLPIALIAWTDANIGKLNSPAATAFASLLDQLMWQRFIRPCQWAGMGILLVCCAISAWKLLSQDHLSLDGINRTSWAAKLLARLLR